MPHSTPLMGWESRGTILTDTFTGPHATAITGRRESASIIGLRVLPFPFPCSHCTTISLGFRSRESPHFRGNIRYELRQATCLIFGVVTGIIGMINDGVQGSP